MRGAGGNLRPYRNPSGVYDDVSFGAAFFSVGGVRACFLAPRGLGTEDPSMLARLQSIWSCSRKRLSMAEGVQNFV